MRYSIWEGNMESFMKKVTRIQNKCKNYGCDFHFEEVGEEYKEVIQLLKKGYSIRNIAKITGYSTQTIQTIKNDFVRPKEDESKEE